jgi:hypothetical protein
MNPFVFPKKAGGGRGVCVGSSEQACAQARISGGRRGRENEGDREWETTLVCQFLLFSFFSQRKSSARGFRRPPGFERDRCGCVAICAGNPRCLLFFTETGEGGEMFA